MTEYSDFHDATYSPEDDKLRLYTENYLDKPLYTRLTEAGFRPAKKQGLFFAHWSPAREDLCLALFGEINPEGTTLVERAQMKADRLDGYASNAAHRSSVFADTANRISQRFYMGQPILVGHHSERSARADQRRMNNAMRKSIDNAKKVNYWGYRAEGVERHANMKANAGVRMRRMDKLLAELRDRQRAINHGFIVLNLWEKIRKVENIEDRKKAVECYVGSRLVTGSTVPYETYTEYSNGDLTVDQAIDRGIAYGNRLTLSNHTRRVIEHLLNRLAYEQSELGEVARYDGDIAQGMLQVFTRAHGAHKPKAEKVEGKWRVSSSVALPVHLGDGNSLTLDDDGWRDLMVNVGYQVPAKKPAKPPILNFKAPVLRGDRWGTTTDFEQIEMTRAEYGKIYTDYKGTQLSLCGQFRFRISTAGRGGFKAVFLTDQKAHPMPESPSIIEPEQETAEA